MILIHWHLNFLPPQVAISNVLDVIVRVWSWSSKMYGDAVPGVEVAVIDPGRDKHRGKEKAQSDGAEMVCISQSYFSIFSYHVNHSSIH